jgi:hypothetical protein
MALISLSRRDLLARTIATGVGGITLSTFPGRPPLAQSLTDPQQVKSGISRWNDTTSSEPSLVKEWLANSEATKATKNEFDSGVHGEWANDWAVVNRSKTYARCSTIFGQLDNPYWMGVVFHPWMHVLGYAPNRTLNTTELATLYESQRFFDRTLNFFSDGQMVFAPFPDTPRIQISSLHEDSFVRILTRANVNPNDFRLHYARYYVMAGRRGSRTVPIPLLAHAYTLRSATDIKESLRISYTSVL